MNDASRFGHAGLVAVSPPGSSQPPGQRVAKSDGLISAGVNTQEPVCVSSSIVPSRLVTTTLTKPVGPRCSAQVAWITLRLLLVGFGSDA
jgi:hypothetical protein